MKWSCVNDFPEGEERLDDDTFVCTPHRIGNSTLLCGRKTSHFPFHILVGPEWRCMLLSYCFLTAPTLVFINTVSMASAPIIFPVTIVFLVVLLCLFSAVALSDPGIVFMQAVDDDIEIANIESGENGTNVATIGSRGEDFSVAFVLAKGVEGEDKAASMSLKRAATMECGRCNIDRPRTATHCYECGVCVDQLDHHCPWSGKCIAKKNMLAFRWFLLVLLMDAGFVVGISIYSFLDFSESNNSMIG